MKPIATFAGGLAIGLVVGGTYPWSIPGRFEIHGSGPVYKVDTVTGACWRLVGRDEASGRVWEWTRIQPAP